MQDQNVGTHKPQLCDQNVTTRGSELESRENND